MNKLAANRLQPQPGPIQEELGPVLSVFDVETDEAGREYLDVEFEISDAAQNTRTVSFPIYLEIGAPTLAEIYRNDLDDRSIPDILLEG